MFSATPLTEALPQGQPDFYHSPYANEGTLDMKLEHTSASHERCQGVEHDRMQTLKTLIKDCTFDQRRELVQYINRLGKCDIVGSIEVPLAYHVLSYLGPEELCKATAETQINPISPFRVATVVSRKWRLRTTDNQVWLPHFRKAKHTLPPTSSLAVYGQEGPDLFFKWYGRYATLAANWRKFSCENFVLQGHTGCVLSLVIAREYVLSGGADTSIRVWDISTRTAIRTISDHKEDVCCLAVNSGETFFASGSYDKSVISDDYRQYLFSGSIDKTIRLWNVETGECLRILYGHQDNCHSVGLRVFPSRRAYHPCKKCFRTSEQVPMDAELAMDSDGEISMPIRTSASSPQQCQFVAPTFSSPMTAAPTITAVSPTLSSATQPDTSISLLSLPLLEPIQAVTPMPTYHRGVIWAITTVTSQMKIITASQDETLQVWDLSEAGNGRCNTVVGFQSPVVCCAVNTGATKMCVGTEAGDVVVFSFEK
ncbi:WD40-repeat-containing domain protein [Jimgerdemannia flammicorona]|uniref:WD40-repeat-containing domain protein n=1 Tax=Jimgerdemannia flammicorona TaxID=994334 RepID=A0A433QCJ7_9FUNG|nr:WD40-repeat-containing domain protein [Jimgerdemannia flammicorona]